MGEHGPTSIRAGRGRIATALVALVFVAAVAVAAGYVLRSGSPIPFGDDFSVVRVLRHPDSLPRWLWSLHNEHRVPLPKLILYGAVRAFGGLRPAMLVQVVVLAATALGYVLAARRLRGRSSVLDAFLPLLWLQLGNHFDLLMAFTIVFSLPAALVSLVFLLGVADERGPLGAGRSLAIAACLVGLPLCGGPGLLWAALPTVALALVGGRMLLRGERTPAAWALLGGAAATTLVVGLYLVGFEVPEAHAERGSFADVLRTAGSFLAMGFGAAAKEHGRELAIGLPLVSALVLFALVRDLRGAASRRAGIGLLFLLANVLLAVGIGWGRSGGGEDTGAAERYVTLACPFLSGLFLASVASSSRRIALVVQTALLAGLLALTPENVDGALGYARRRRNVSEAVQADARAGWSPRQVAARQAANTGYKPREVLMGLYEDLDALSLPPFEEARGQGAPDVEPPYFMFGARPTSASSPKKIRPARVDLLPVLLVHAEGELRFDVPAEAAEVELGCGIHPQAHASGGSDGLVLVVEAPGADGSPAVLFREEIEPGAADERDLRQRTLPIPAGARELVFRTTNLPGRTTEMDWSYWTGIRFLDGRGRPLPPAAVEPEGQR